MKNERMHSKFRLPAHGIRRALFDNKLWIPAHLITDF
jgi:hypothetical protein